ncbi:hypothetical protein J3R30DRAFT_3703539 [Lentinula aciculospora]|uniref:Uncharacterized protein n=1 Tax=Lentinula aciculospora TaxID=153920 RepID=A0A9W9DMX6_9AGAR|nr:hypothetical protein J3R30DRAFT_3703539 [Lentinula aciculospora]
MRFFFSLLSLFALFTTAVQAQNAYIYTPADMTEVSAGSTFNVTISQPASIVGLLVQFKVTDCPSDALQDSNSSWKNIAIVIALLNCHEYGSTCLGPAEELGTILYSGAFNPQFTTDPGTAGLPPHENFTLTIPSDFETGQSQLGVALFDLVGALLFPNLQTFNTTIIVT